MDYADGFPYIYLSLHPWDEAYLILVNDCFDVFLDSVSGNFIEYFSIDIYNRDWLEVLILSWVFAWFRYQSNCDFIE